MKQAATFKSLTWMFVLTFVYFASGPTADADHKCGNGCAKVVRGLHVERTDDGKIDVRAMTERRENRRRMQYHGHSSTAFYVLNMGPLAIERLAISPDHYRAWGCAKWPWGLNCNRLTGGRIEAGQRVFFQIHYDYYDEDEVETVYDIEIDDSGGARKTEESIRILRSGPIPTLIIRTGTSSRESCVNSMSAIARILNAVTFEALFQCEKHWQQPYATLSTH